ncbi:MAG: hypothetical protein WCC40_00670, partial [Rhodomicrobium sp.]
MTKGCERNDIARVYWVLACAGTTALPFTLGIRPAACGLSRPRIWCVLLLRLGGVLVLLLWRA